MLKYPFWNNLKASCITIGLCTIAIMFNIGYESVSISIYRDSENRTKVIKERTAFWNDTKINVYQLPNDMTIFDIEK